MTEKFFDEIPIFEWDDLDGKTLLVRVSTEGAYKCLHAYDPIDNVTYVLADKMIK